MGDGRELELGEETIERLARRVVQLLQPSPLAVPDATQTHLTAAEVAKRLGVRPPWVYAHATELGAVRLGGPRGRLRFDPETVQQVLSPCPSRRGSQRPEDPMNTPYRSTRHTSRSGTGASLLPIRRSGRSA